MTIPQIANVNGIAATASAAELDPSVVTKTELISDKSGKNVLGTTVEATEEAYDKFYDTHGTEFKLKLSLNIPDDAQPGDTLEIKKENAHAHIGSFEVKGTIPATTSDGKVVGHTNINGGNTIVFTVSDQVTNSVNRKAFFEIPVTISESKHTTPTYDKEKEGRIDINTLSFAHDATATLTMKQVRVYEEYIAKPNFIHRDYPNYTSKFQSVNLNTGVARFTPDPTIGHANPITVDEGNSPSPQDNVYKIDPEAKTKRDVTIRYTIDDPNGRVFATGSDIDYYVYTFSPTGFKNISGEEPGNTFFLDAGDKSYKITHKQINKQTVDVTIHNIEPDHALSMNNPHQPIIVAESPYSPGKTVTVTSEFVNGVGNPHTAYDAMYTAKDVREYTHPVFDGYGSADDIKREITMSAKVNGQDADNISAAQTVENGKAKFSIDLENKGNIGAKSATIKYPKGVTGPNGETEKFIDFENEGFPAGSTKTLELGELNVPEGTSENKFTVTITGYPELTDPAWTATGPTDVFVEEVKDNGDNTYTINRNDGKSWTIDASGSVDNIKPDGKGNLIVTIDGKDQKVPLDKVKVTEANKGTKNHTVTIATPDGKSVSFNAFDNHLVSINQPSKGKYEFVLKDNTKLKGIIDVSGDVVDVKTQPNGDIVLVYRDGKKSKPIDLKHTTVTEANKGKPNHTITITTPEGKKVSFNAFDNVVTKIKHDGKGTYTLVRADDTTVEGKLDLSGNIKNVENGPNGSIILTFNDGTKSKPITLSQTTITEKNKGKPGHTVTITSPNGDKVTFNAFDTYVTDIKWNEEKGLYEVYRSDKGNGKTLWKTIDLSDLRGRIEALEAKDSPTREEFNAVKRDLNKFKTEVNNNFKEVRGDINKLRSDLTALDVRVTNLEARMDKVEGTLDDLGKCLSGVALTSIPAALSIPLLVLSQTNLPGVQQINTDIQKQIGVYDKNLANMWAQHGDIFKIAAVATALAGIAGGIGYAATECQPYAKSDGFNKTTAGQLSSKLDRSGAATAEEVEVEAEDK